MRACLLTTAKLAKGVGKSLSCDSRLRASGEAARERERDEENYATCGRLHFLLLQKRINLTGEARKDVDATSMYKTVHRVFPGDERAVVQTSCIARSTRSFEQHNPSSSISRGSFQARMEAGETWCRLQLQAVIALWHNGSGASGRLFCRARWPQAASKTVFGVPCMVQKSLERPPQNSGCW